MKKLFTKYESGLLIKLIENTHSNQYVMVGNQLIRDVSSCVESLEETIKSLKEVDLATYELINNVWKAYDVEPDDEANVQMYMFKDPNDGEMIEMMFESYELIVEEIVKAIKQNTEEVIYSATNK